MEGGVTGQFGLVVASLAEEVLKGELDSVSTRNQQMEASLVVRMTWKQETVMLNHVQVRNEQQFDEK